MADWEDTGQRYRGSPSAYGRESDPEYDLEHPFADRPDEWRRIRDTAYAGVPGQDEGVEGPGPYYPEYQISGQVIRPDPGYEYEAGPGPRWRETSERPGPGQGRDWREAHEGWERPSRRWAEAHSPPGWGRISRGHAVGHPPEAWTRPGSISLTTGGVGGHYGLGPKGYVRSDERIREDVCDRFMSTNAVDCSNIEVGVNNGEVTLSGTVESRWAKHRAEDVAADVLGVKDVDNRLRIASQPAAK